MLDEGGGVADDGGGVAGSDVVVVDELLEELVDGLEVAVEATGVEEADAEGAAPEPEEPPPHDAQASAARMTTTIFIAALPISISWRPIMHIACPEAGP